MAVVTSQNNWIIENRESRKKRGPLVRVEIRPNQFVKMYQSDADAQGLNYAGKKAPAGGNKMRKPQEDKSQKPQPKPKEAPKAPDPAQAPADFTTIPGVGPATDRAIKAAGIQSFADLESSDLAFLSESARDAIKDYFVIYGGGDE